MKHRLLAVITIALTSTVTLSVAPTGVAPVAHAVACNLEGVPVLFPGTLSPGVSRLPEWASYTNSGAAVNCLEQRLQELGYTVNAPDSTYDSTTKAAVQAYQLSRGYHPDGVVSPALMRQLSLRGTNPAGPSTPKVTWLADSVSAAMRWTDEINSNSSAATQRYDILGNTYDLVWSLESCRRLVAASCTSRTGRYTTERPAPVSVLPLIQGSLSGRLGEAIVVSAGYDDTSITNAIEQIMTEATNQGVARVYWMTYRIDPSRSYPYKAYYAKHNLDLQNAKVRWPNLTVLDWNTYSAGQTSWITSDGIHLTPTGATAMANYLKGVLDASDVGGCTVGQAQAGEPDPTVGTPAAPADADTGFASITPVRMLDTRNVSLGGGDGKLGAGNTIDVDLSAEVPGGAESVVVNVTAVNPCARGYLTVFACGTRPDTSNANFVAGRTTAAVAISTHADGHLCVYSSVRTDLIVDLVGAFVPGGELFHPLEPTRWVDTRGNAAEVTIPGPLASGSQVNVPVAGTGDVPADATAVWINLTGVRSPTNAVLQVYPGPCGTPPSTSTVNVLANRAAATTALVALGTNGGICVRAFSGTPDVIVDVSGWFGGAAPDGLVYRAVVPDRLFDTRPGPMASAGADVPVEIDATSVVTVTAINSTGFGFVSAEPCGATGTSSLLNTALAESVANVGAVGKGTGANMCVNPSVATHLAVDLSGVFVAPSPG